MKRSLKRIAPLLTALIVAAVGFVAFTALGVGGGGAQTVPTRPAKLVSASDAARYAADAQSRENFGNANGAAPNSELAPLKVSDFNAPIAQARRYAVAQLGLMEPQIATLQQALRAGDRAAAQSAWRQAYATYLHLGSVYGEFGALDEKIDGSAGGIPGGTSSPQFTGLHRIEYGLWSGADPKSLLPVAQQLASDVRALRAFVPKAQITPLDYSLRAHEILEDAVRDLMSGVDVPWSHEGVLATAAGIVATEEILGELRPLLDGREDAIELADSGMARLNRVMASVKAAHGGQYPTLNQLTQGQSERLNGALGAALEDLSQVPGALETQLPPPIPKLPG